MLCLAVDDVPSSPASSVWEKKFMVEFGNASDPGWRREGVLVLVSETQFSSPVPIAG